MTVEHERVTWSDQFAAERREFSAILWDEEGLAFGVADPNHPFSFTMSKMLEANDRPTDFVSMISLGDEEVDEDGDAEDHES